jgi:hypothetical protein
LIANADAITSADRATRIANAETKLKQDVIDIHASMGRELRALDDKLWADSIKRTIETGAVREQVELSTAALTIRSTEQREAKRLEILRQYAGADVEASRQEASASYLTELEAQHRKLGDTEEFLIARAKLFKEFGAQLQLIERQNERDLLSQQQAFHERVKADGLALGRDMGQDRSHANESPEMASARAAHASAVETGQGILARAQQANDADAVARAQQDLADEEQNFQMTIQRLNTGMTETGVAALEAATGLQQLASGLKPTAIGTARGAAGSTPQTSSGVPIFVHPGAPGTPGSPDYIVNGHSRGAFSPTGGAFKDFMPQDASGFGGSNQTFNTNVSGILMGSDPGAKLQLQQLINDAITNAMRSQRKLPAA